MKNKHIENIIIAIEVIIALVFIILCALLVRDSDLNIIYRKALIQSKGYMLYRDMTSFLPPLAYFPLNVLLHINNTFKTAQVLGCIQSIITMILVIKLAYRITNNRLVSFTYGTIINSIALTFAYKQYNYNATCIILILTIILIETSSKTKNQLYKDILVGILVSIVCLTKHSIGIMVFIASIIIVACNGGGRAYQEKSITNTNINTINNRGNHTN